MKQPLRLLVVVALVACSEAFQPTVDNVIGSYRARTFTIIKGTDTTDLLKAGAMFYINLSPRGSTSGYVYVPAIGVDPEVIEDIDGTWTLSQGLILIDQTGGNFVQNMAFFAERRQLYASRSSPSIGVRALMIKD